MDEKFLYITKTLSRTKRKDFENYVVNAIWNRIGQPELKPVSQQYLAKPDGGHYLIDLYFPQLNIGIECDEEHHKKQSVKDADREITISDVLNRVINTSTYLALHIDVTKSYENIEKQINSHVSLIKEKLSDLEQNGDFVKWAIKTPAEYFEGKRTITVADDIAFSTMAEACNTVFGTSYSGLQKSYFVPKTLREQFGDKYRVWFPILAAEGKAVKGGWNNELSHDGSYIIVYNEDEEMNKESLITPHYGEERIVFAKSVNLISNAKEYKFAGVFKYEKSIGRKNYYCRVADSFSLIRV